MIDFIRTISPLSVTVVSVLAMLSLGILISVVRLLKGPTLPDRVVAIDLIATQAVAFLASAAIAFDQPALLQPALVLTAIAFVGTVAFARYVAKGAES